MSCARTQNTLKSRSRNLNSRNVSGSRRKTLVSPSREVSHLPFATLLLNGCDLYFRWRDTADQGRVVRKPVKANTGLKVNLSNNFFSSKEIFFADYVLYSLRLLKLKTEGQTI